MSSEALPSAASSAPSRSAVHVLCWAGFAVFTLYLLWVNNSYYHANTRTPTYDEAWYLETSLHLYHRLTRGSLAEFLEAYRHAFGVKAPLISVLPLPLYLLFGTSYPSALLVNSFFLVIINIYLFLLARRLFSAEVGLAATVFYQTMPLACGLSRAVLTEYGLAALVIVWLYYLAASERLSRGPANFALGVVLGLGLLMKILFPAFIAGPFLLVGMLRRRNPPSPPAERFWLWRICARRPFAAIAMPGLAIAATWYAFHLAELLRFAWQSSYGEIGENYAGGGLVAWVLRFLNEGTGCYYAAALLVLGAAALAASRHRARWDFRAWFLLAWLLPPLVAIAAGRNHLIRFILPLLPVFAIALAAAIFSLGRRWILQAALALLVAIVPQRLYAALSYFPHGAGHEHAVRYGPFILFSRDLGWAHPPVFEESWGQQRLLAALHRLSATAARSQYAIVAVEHVYLNANLLSYLNAYEEYPLLFTTPGYAESSLDRAIDRIYSFDARFLILGEGFRDLPPFLNRLNGDLQAAVARGELPFHLEATVDLTHQMKALLYERDAPWKSIPPGADAPAPSHSQPADFIGGVRFLGYDWARRDSRLWQISYYWTTTSRVGQDYRITVDFIRGGHTLLTRDHEIASGHHPFREWAPGEIIVETAPVYFPPGSSGPIEARLQLTPWGLGPAQPLASGHGPAVVLRLSE
ncbi:MAG TPA: glycosyltransferase family 39 protein [Bryobacterales bacterium]|nr:glycosyltransferase family 39 protein [Bryobacterales bacterium]